MKKNKNQPGLAERIKAPTPKFFKKIRNAGLLLGAVGGSMLAAPVALPAALVSIAGYLATAGMVATAVSSVAVEGEGSN